jgi:hypothetical protein
MPDRVKLPEAMRRVLLQLADHAGEFRNGYGRSAHALARRGLAKRRFVIDRGNLLAPIAKFAIASAGRALLASNAKEE